MSTKRKASRYKYSELNKARKRWVLLHDIIRTINLLQRATIKKLDDPVNLNF